MARLIDEARSGVTSEQPLAEPPPVEQQQPQPEVTAQPEDPVAKALAENPALLAEVQKVIATETAKSNYAAQQYATIAAVNAQAAAASVLSAFPELNGLSAAQIPTAIQIVAKQSPDRARAMVNHIEQVRSLVNEGQQASQYLAARQQQQYRAAFDQNAALHDRAYDQWIRNQGVTPIEHSEIYNEVMADFRRQGWIRRR